MNHPFVDGNKRTALEAAMVFLDYNGYVLNEGSDEELADQILDFINKNITQEDLANYLETHSQKIYK